MANGLRLCFACVCIISLTNTETLRAQAGGQSVTIDLQDAGTCTVTVTSPSNHGVAEASGGGVLGVTTLDDSVSKMTFHLEFTAGDGYELTKPESPSTDETISIGGSSIVEYELKETGDDTGNESDPDAEKTGVKSGEIKLYASAFRTFINGTPGEKDDILFLDRDPQGNPVGDQLNLCNGTLDFEVKSEVDLTFSNFKGGTQAAIAEQTSGPFSAGSFPVTLIPLFDSNGQNMSTIESQETASSVISVQDLTVQGDDIYKGSYTVLVSWTEKKVETGPGITGWSIGVGLDCALAPSVSVALNGTFGDTIWEPLSSTPDKQVLDPDGMPSAIAPPAGTWLGMPELISTTSGHKQMTESIDGSLRSFSEKHVIRWQRRFGSQQ